MRARNYLPTTDPYYGSKTARQWLLEGRAVNEGAGKMFWVNAYKNTKACYYTEEETHPATPEELAAFREQQKRSRAARKAAQEAAAAREQARKEQLMAELREFVNVPPEDVICLDTETTGVTYDDEILQVSIIDGRGEVLFNEYVRPTGITEWPEAEGIHGISPAMVADKPTIEEYEPTLNRIIGAAKLIVGYNVEFDLDFLRRANVEVPNAARTFDVMYKFAPVYGEKHFKGGYRWQKLAVCADYFGYEGNGEFHDSLEDVRATLFCYYALTQTEL